MNIKEKLVQKIQKMEGSDRLLEEAYNFIRFLEQKEEQREVTRLSEKSLAEIWDNSEDAIYDRYLP